MQSSDICQKFIDFFVHNGHTPVPSSPVVPAQDPTLLFTNAGMNQFKDIFLGLEQRKYSAAVSIQKCIRSGGKHNDLDNVGFTPRHLTFFEMMGNFSFGSYFKQEAIAYAWDFLTRVLEIPAGKLYTTVYETDEDAFQIWHRSIGLAPERIYRCGAADNFWQMGDTGPCGPCSEIYFDRGASSVSCAAPSACNLLCSCGRFIEIWNLVFIQYDRQADGTDTPLKKVGVDTGMGLERLCMVMQNKQSVFETDIFDGLRDKIQQLTGTEYHLSSEAIKSAYNVLMDHVRSAAFIIADGVAPSNEGRGYVLRKIIRRAALFSQKFDVPELFALLSNELVDSMGDRYPELAANRQIIFNIVASEVEKFSHNLVRGQNMLDRYFHEHQSTGVVTGKYAFTLYDTFGFPLELLNVMARERNFTVDQEEFNLLMQEQQSQSVKKNVSELDLLEVEGLSSEFTGYQELETCSSITAIIVGGKFVDRAMAGDMCWVVGARSPFFIVGGGQVPDQGWLIVKDCRMPLREVRFIGKAIAAQVLAEIAFSVGDSLMSIVDTKRRLDAMRNHTATHLLQAALMQVLGKQVKQSGSLVHPDYLRFDFSYNRPLSASELNQVEDIINQKVWQDIPVGVNYTDLKSATEQGALAFFGDKYNPEQVRVVSVADFSVELCGGTHVASTGQIGLCKIIEASALSAGHRRIVAVTGTAALELFRASFEVIKELSIAYKVKRTEVLPAVEKQRVLCKELQQKLKAAKREVLIAQLELLKPTARSAGGIPFFFVRATDMESDTVHEVVSPLAESDPGFYCVLNQAGDAKWSFFVYLSSVLRDYVNLKECATFFQDQLGLRARARDGQLQGGGTMVPVDVADQLRDWLNKNARM